METESRARPNGETFLAVQKSAQFKQLRQRSRRFIALMAGAFSGWWLLTALLAGWAPGFFDTKVAGAVNVGFLFILAQFASTIAIVAIYVTYASRKLDPAANRIRAEIEGNYNGTQPRARHSESGLPHSI